MARRTKSSPKPPDKDKVLAQIKLAEAYWGPLHNEQQTDYAIVQNLQPILVPAGYTPYYTGTGFSIIDTAAQHITGNVPQIDVPEANPSLEAQKRSERLEDGLRDAQFRQDQESSDDIRRTIVKNGLWSGMFVDKGPIFMPDKWGKIPTKDEFENTDDYNSAVEEYEATKKLNWPILRQAVDPRYVFPDPGTTGKKWVAVRYEREVGQIRALIPEWDGRLAGTSKEADPLPDTQLVTWTEWWDEHYCGYFAGDTLLLDKFFEHTNGKPPFHIKSAGYGVDTGTPEERFRSIIYPARGLLNAKIAILNQLIAITRRTAWPFGLTPEGFPINEMTPGKWLEFPAEMIDKPRKLDEFDPQIAQHLMALIGMIDQQIEHVTFPNVVAGFAAIGGSRAGYFQNSLVAQAKVKFEPAIRNLTLLEQDYQVDLARCVVNDIGEDLPVWGTTRWGKVDSTIKLDDAKGLRNVVVNLNPKLPMDRANEIAIGQILKQLDVITDDIFLSDFAGYSEPGKILEAVRVQNALKDPTIQRVFTFAAFLETDYADAVFEAADKLGIQKIDLLKMLGFGAPPQGGAPGPEASGAPQNVAEQIGTTRPTSFGGGAVAAPPTSLFGENNNTQPGPPGNTAMTGPLPMRGRAIPRAAIAATTPGTPSNVRDIAAPGVAIGR